MKASKKDRKPSFRKWVLLLWLAMIMPVVGLAGMLYLISEDVFGPLPTFEQLENPKSDLASEVFTADQEILGTYFRQNRSNVRKDEIAPVVFQALVATEDERFYDHSGIDLRGLARAIAGGGTKGGASTITQQLAKMLFSDKPRTKITRVLQKLKEWIIAVRLERRYTKDEIITMYMNRFDFINQGVGIKSASRVYFGTTPDSLALNEAAMLVGMAKNPALFNPIRFPDTTQQRRNVVYGQMKRNGLLTQAEFDSLKMEPLGLNFSKVDHKEGLAPYFREVLRMELKKIFSKKNPETDKYIYQKADGKPYNIYRDGLRVYTTINSRMQKHAEYAVKQHLGGELQKQFDREVWKKSWYRKHPPFAKVSTKDYNSIMRHAQEKTDRYRIMAGEQCARCGRRGRHVKTVEEEGGTFYVCQAEDCQLKRRATPADSIGISFDTPIPMTVFSWNGEIDTVMSPNDSLKYYKSFLQAGLMSIDPTTGFIKAWVGGIDYKHFSYDHVRQGKRQVGSTFKPFIYSLAMQDLKTYGPCYEVPNTIICWDMPDGQPRYCPKNSDAEYGDLVTLKWGLSQSMNTITAYLVKRFGPQAVVDFAKKAGITSPLKAVPSLGFGVADLSVYEMAGAYTTFANKGRRLEPVFISRIEDKNGVVIYEPRQESHEVMSEESAYRMLQLMQGVTGYNYHPTKGKKGGTGIRLRFESEARPYAGFTNPIAAKTGTTQGNSDGWFMGTTPDLVTAVWVGAEDRSIHFSRTHYGQGANTALPIWGYYMKKVYADKNLNVSDGDFEKPQSGGNFEIDCERVINQRNADPFDHGSGGDDDDWD